MRILVVLFVLMIFSLGCTSDKVLMIDEQLNTNIEKIIIEYDRYLKEEDNLSFDPPLYEVTFKEYEGICHVIVNTNNIYHSKLDGYIFFNNKLVTFNNTSSRCNNNWVRVKEKVDLERLTKYQDENAPADIYDPAFWEFRIEGDSLVASRQNRLKIDF
jgi:hypothetical protein